MKEYPAELTVVFFYNLCVSVLAAIVGVFAEPNISAWRIKADIALASILCSVSRLRVMDIKFYEDRCLIVGFAVWCSRGFSGHS